MITTTLRMPEELHAELRRQAFSERESLNTVMINRLKAAGCEICHTGTAKYCEACLEVGADIVRGGL